MRDQMKKGDLALFYHSSAEPPGVAGVCQISKEGYLEAKPSWFQVDVEFVEKFKRFVPLDELKANKKLSGMLVLRKGQRLSVQPVEKAHFDEAVRLGKKFVAVLLLLAFLPLASAEAARVKKKSTVSAWEGFQNSANGAVHNLSPWNWFGPKPKKKGGYPKIPYSQQ